MNEPSVSLSTILIAEDDPDDQMLNRDALRDAHLPWQPVFLENGVQIMEYLHAMTQVTLPRAGGLPVLILLDLQMPTKNGWETLREIEAHPLLRVIPIVILTTSSNDEDRRRAYELGAAGFYTKPPSYRELVAILKEIYHKDYASQ